MTGQRPVPTPQQVLDLELPDNASGQTTVRGYLTALLLKVWQDGPLFDTVCPFGDPNWAYDLYIPLVQAGWVAGVIDTDDGYVTDLDDTGADILIESAIRALTAADTIGAAADPHEMTLSNTLWLEPVNPVTELTAMRRCVNALADLDEAAQRRAIRWLAAVHGLTVTALDG